MGTNVVTKQDGSLLTVDVEWDGKEDPKDIKTDNSENTSVTGARRDSSVITPAQVPNTASNEEKPLKTPVTKKPRVPRVKKPQAPVPPDIPDIRYLHNLPDDAPNPFSDPNSPDPFGRSPDSALKQISDETGKLSEIVTEVKKTNDEQIVTAQKAQTPSKIEKQVQPKITPIVTPEDIQPTEAPKSNKLFSALKALTGVVKEQWNDKEEYKDQYRDENSSRKTKFTRLALASATKENPLLLRAFDKFTRSAKKIEEDRIATETKSIENSDPGTLKSKTPRKTTAKTTAKTSIPDSSSARGESEETVPILNKIVLKLEEIKDTLTKSGTPADKTKNLVLDLALKLKKTMTAMYKNVKQIGVRDNVPKPARFVRDASSYRKRAPITPGNRRILPTLAKSPAQSMMALAKTKEAVPSTLLKSPLEAAIPEAGGGIMDMLGGAAAGASSRGLAGRLLPNIARFAMPAAAVAGAGYAGYKTGEYLNEKMDGTIVGEARDSVGQSAIATLDKMTGGMLSPNKQIADEMYNETTLGKATGRLGDKFVKTRDAATETLTGLYGKSKDTVTNITQTVPKLVDELDSQGIAPTLKQKAMVLGQLAHETGGFSKMEEGKYSAENVWKLRGPQLEKFGVTKEKLAAEEKTGGKDAMYEYMYADRYRSGSSRLGNDQPGDAAKYKGRGLSQLTGKSNYARVGKEIGVDLVKDPDQIVKNPAINAKVTAHYLKNNKLVREGLERGDIAKVSQGINGGAYGQSNGAADRTLQTNRIAAGLEKSMAEAPYSEHLENSALASVNSRQTQSPQIIAVNNTTDRANMVGSEQQAAPTIMARNPDSSLQRITEGQMSYGIA